MTQIKTRDLFEKNIKQIKRNEVWVEKVKDDVHKKEMQEQSSTRYCEEKVTNTSKVTTVAVTTESTKMAVKIPGKFNNKFNSVILNKKNIQSNQKQQGQKLAIEMKKENTKHEKKVIKITKSVINNIIDQTKKLVTILSAGGVVAFIIILIISLIALVFSSGFGIFFSNEASSISISEVITSTNKELYNIIEQQRELLNVDDYDIEYENNNWREVISLYSVGYDNSYSNNPVMYLDEDNISKIKQIFWDMNNITYKIVLEEKESETLSDGDYITTLQQKKVLHIKVNQKNIQDYMEEMNFSNNQKQQVLDLLNQKNDDLWNNLLYGSYDTNNINLVNIAKQELGNINGDKYWKWYGFKNHVAWCAIFVSWVADQANILNISIPKFSLVGDGARWFKERGLWEGNGYIPKSGDLIFFDWDGDKKLNHVGIVERVENNYIYVIEGNSNNQCKENKYKIKDKNISGYGKYY